MVPMDKCQLLMPSNSSDPPYLKYFYFIKAGFSILGLIFNIISMIYFATATQFKIFNLLLLHLSCVEVLFCLSGFIFEVTYYWFAAKHNLIPHIWVAKTIIYTVYFIVWVIYKASLLARNWITAIIAWQRYRAISSPLTNIQYDSSKSISVILFIVYLLVILISAPRAFEKSYHICNDRVFIVAVSNSIYYTELYKTIYNPLFFFVSSPLPLAVIVVCSTTMLIVLKRRQTDFNSITLRPLNSNRTQHVNSRSQNINKTVIILCVAFTICELPACVAGIMLNLSSDMAIWRVLSYFVGIAMVLTSVDSLLDFFIYFYSITHFRQAIYNFIFMRKYRSSTNSMSVKRSELSTQRYT